MVSTPSGMVVRRWLAWFRLGLSGVRLVPERGWNMEEEEDERHVHLESMWLDVFKTFSKKK